MKTVLMVILLSGLSDSEEIKNRRLEVLSFGDIFSPFFARGVKLFPGKKQEMGLNFQVDFEGKQTLVFESLLGEFGIKCSGEDTSECKVTDPIVKKDVYREGKYSYVEATLPLRYFASDETDLLMPIRLVKEAELFPVPRWNVVGLERDSEFNSYAARVYGAHTLTYSTEDDYQIMEIVFQHIQSVQMGTFDLEAPFAIKAELNREDKKFSNGKACFLPEISVVFGFEDATKFCEEEKKKICPTENCTPEYADLTQGASLLMKVGDTNFPFFSEELFEFADEKSSSLVCKVSVVSRKGCDFIIGGLFLSKYKFTRSTTQQKLTFLPFLDADESEIKPKIIAGILLLLSLIAFTWAILKFKKTSKFEEKLIRNSSQIQD